MIRSILKNKLSKGILLILIISILGLTSLLGINIYVKASTKTNIISVEEAANIDADCIIVLGAKVYDNKYPSPMLEDRLNQSIELFNILQNKILSISKIIPTLNIVFNFIVNTSPLF